MKVEIEVTKSDLTVLRQRMGIKTNTSRGYYKGANNPCKGGRARVNI